jgi:hypothetical protein
MHYTHGMRYTGQGQTVYPQRRFPHVERKREVVLARQRHWLVPTL